MLYNIPFGSRNVINTIGLTKYYGMQLNISQKFIISLGVKLNFAVNSYTENFHRCNEIIVIRSTINIMALLHSNI